MVLTLRSPQTSRSFMDTQREPPAFRIPNRRIAHGLLTISMDIWVEGYIICAVRTNIERERKGVNFRTLRLTAR